MLLTIYQPLTLYLPLPLPLYLPLTLPLPLPLPLLLPLLTISGEGGGNDSHESRWQRGSPASLQPEHSTSASKSVHTSSSTLLMCSVPTCVQRKQVYLGFRLFNFQEQVTTMCGRVNLYSSTVVVQ